MIFETKEIVNTLHEKYLKFRTWNIVDISDTLSNVLPIMQKRGVLDSKLELGILQLKSKLERRQCSECYYINCLGADEVKECLRCGSEKLVDFPNRLKR